jgi:hypothetical protein
LTILVMHHAAAPGSIVAPARYRIEKTAESGFHPAAPGRMQRIES